MPGEFGIYSMRQFLPITPEAYFRLFERLNEALWPFEVFAFIARIVVPILMRRGNGAMAGILWGLCWCGARSNRHGHTGCASANPVCTLVAGPCSRALVSIQWRDLVCAGLAARPF